MRFSAFVRIRPDGVESDVKSDPAPEGGEEFEGDAFAELVKLAQRPLEFESVRP